MPWRRRHNPEVQDLEQGNGTAMQEIHPARIGPAPPNPAHTAAIDAAIPPQLHAPVARPEEQLLRLVGPNVGDFTMSNVPGHSTVPPEALTWWMDQSEKHTSLTSFALYIHTHRERTRINPLTPGNSIPPWTAETQALLSLPGPTHVLTLSCDCNAPQAQLDLYVLASRRQGTIVRAPTEPILGHEAQECGWRIASHRMTTGYDTTVQLPLLLDHDWVGQGWIPIAVTLEAYGEDGCPLESTNALTSIWHCSESPSSPGHYLYQSKSQVATFGTRHLHLHELFGFSASTEQHVPSASEMGTQQDDLPQGTGHEPLMFNADLMATATLLAESDRSEGAECPICMSEPSTTVLFPCTHALCLECAVQVRDSVQKARAQDRSQGRESRRQYVCPLCRRLIESMLNLRMDIPK